MIWTSAVNISYDGRIACRMTVDSNFVLRFEVDGAKIVQNHAESESFNEGGFIWKVGVTKTPDDYIDFTLTCDHPRGEEWRCEANIKLKLFNFPFRDTQFVFDEKIRVCTANRIVSVEDFYFMLETVRIDKTVAEFRINITSSEYAPIIDVTKFSTPNQSGNVTLLIEEKEVKVSKDILAIHSPVFSAMFFGDYAEKNKEEIELKDIAYEEFLDLLQLIFLQTTTITDHTVSHILKLADRFQMERLMELSAKHLTRSNGFDATKKLLISDQYRLHSLRDKCLKSFTDVSSLNEIIKTSPEYGNFSERLKAAICDRIKEI